MEVVPLAVLGALTGSLMTKLLTAAEKMCEDKDKASKDFKDNIDHLQKELPMIYAVMEDQLSHQYHTGQPSVVATISMDQFSDLVHEIEDCLDRFLPCSLCHGGKQVQSVKKEFHDQIAGLRKKLDGAHERNKNYDVKNQQAASASAKSNVVKATNHEPTGTYGAFRAVGMEKPTQELGDLLVGGEASKLKVISIVGIGGSGKTALAWAAYDCNQVKKRFLCRVWAMASRNDATTIQQDAQVLLTAILKGLLGAKVQPVPQEFRQLQQQISGLLETKRCLIVIDDIKLELWGEIERIFPEKKTESRILVTTAVTSVARTCSFHGGYVYNMRSLSAEHSKDYLDSELFARPPYPSPAFEISSKAIVNKCHGYPLALVSVAKALQGCSFKPEDCEGFSRNLASSMHENKNGNFEKLRQVLMNNYNSLPENSHKTCLLYASLFPDNRPFSTGSLIRRLSAEGYIEGTDGCSDLQVAYDHLEELIDRNIIQPIDANNNSKVKTCRTHGVMNQLMLHKSRSSNFIATSFSDKNRSKCRHLVIQNRSTSTSGKGTALLRPRSLTVFGSAGEAVSDLTSCELLRVLDLKDCNGLNEDHLKYIYKLLQLKYLTLGGSVYKLSGEMKNLHRLETLDLRKTKIETLPGEVLSLPHLAHLFGKIKLLKAGSKNCKNSNLQTLAGVVVDNDSGFPELMVRMKKLTRVKIWCEITSTHRNYTLLSEAIQDFTKAGIDTPTGPRSLSLHLNDYSEDLLHYHQRNNTSTTSTKLGYLTSLKLQGRPNELRQFLMSLDGLRELCLKSGNLTGPALSELEMLKRLVYLKLDQVHLGDFDINIGDIPSLQRLCLVVQEPRLPTIAKGALPSLTSIQVLCEDLEDLCDIKIEWLADLQEIGLDSIVKPKTIELWENEAKNHPKRPRVMLLKRVIDPAETGPSKKYVASC